MKVINIASYGGSGTTFSVSRTGSVGIGGLGSAAPAYIKSDGSAEFASTVEVGTFDTSSTTAAATRIQTGIVKIQRPSSTSGTASAIEVWRGTTNTAKVTVDGSTEFAGTIQAGGDPRDGASTGARLINTGGLYLTRANGTDPLFRGFIQGSSNRNVEIFANGSATFQGNVIGNDGLTVTNTSQRSRFISSNALPAALQCQAVVLITMLSNALTLLALSKPLIAADGSASFAGVTSSNQISVDRPASSSTSGVRVFGGGATKTTLFTDGSASFAGNITAGNVSDVKFKENITDANPQLDDVVALGSSLKNWDWKEEAPLNDELKSKRFLDSLLRKQNRSALV